MLYVLGKYKEATTRKSKEATHPTDASDIKDLESARAEVPRAIDKHQVCTDDALRNFIFLDIDGVVHPLNASGFPAKADFAVGMERGDGEVIEGEFLPECMALVKKIACETNAEIVLSSSWREIPSNLAAVKSQFVLHNLPALASCTPRATSRAAEICIWLQDRFGENAVDTCCFVALDDVDLRFSMVSNYGKILAAGHFVKTDPRVALTAADAARAIQLMRAQQQKQKQRQKQLTTKVPDKTKSRTRDASAGTFDSDEEDDFVSNRTKIRVDASSDADWSHTDMSDTDEDDSVSSDSDCNKLRMTKQTNLLVKRQNSKLPPALEALKRHRRKIGCWAWWCFPTELEGACEPRPNTCVTTKTAAGLVHHAPKVWRELLETICDLAEDGYIGRAVLPSIDHGRVTFFIKFWENLPHGVTPPWLLSVLERLKPFYGKKNRYSSGVRHFHLEI